jgi:hypothetical protein
VSRAAAGLVHPVPLVAMLVLALNDHWAKAAFPGLVTGKVSDFAGLAFFPLLLQAGWEVALRRPASHRVLRRATVVTGLVFALTKTWPPANDAWAWALGVLQWPALAVARGQPAPVPVLAVCDPTDLVALPALGLALWAGRGRGADAPAATPAPPSPAGD